MNNSDKQKRVYELLLTPIICNKGIEKISLEDGCILSGQRYISSYADPDMSDLAVGFYEILYGKFLNGGIMLNDSCFFANTDFAGDTMNSFNSIANATPDVGANTKLRQSIEKWPSFLQKYYSQYRCLANFWVIPMKLGRQSMKFNRYDAMALCLSTLKADYIGCMYKYKDYIAKIPDFERLCHIHFISDGHNRDMIENLYRNRGGEKLVAIATKDIMDRANKIAKSHLSENLFDYFLSLGLI